MDSYGFLDFKVISQTPFKDVFNALTLEYREDNGKLVMDNAIVDTNKNLFFNPHDKKEAGSVIKFVQLHKACSLRDAAFFIKGLANVPVEEKKVPELELIYHPHLSEFAPEDLCKFLGVGFCKQKSIMNGRICFKVGEHYIGYHPEKKDWYFPKNFKLDTLWNIDNCDGNRIVVMANPFDALTLVASGLHYAASIMRENMTEAQERLLGRYKYILLFHDKPPLDKLAGNSFAKVLPANLKLTKDEIEAHF
jgi:hypothetical protein